MNERDVPVISRNSLTRSKRGAAVSRTISALILSSATLKATNDLLKELKRVVQQLLELSHLRLEVRSDGQSVDLEPI